VRLSGTPVAVKSAAAAIGGRELADPETFWAALREHRQPFFSCRALWRLAVPSVTPPLQLPGTQCIEWGGGLRWLSSTASPAEVREAARRAGGHATLFRAADKSPGAFAPLEPLIAQLHVALKRAFDPAGIFNPGRLYPQL
jgi:glycolate oxidase FAD binding subunit